METLRYAIADAEVPPVPNAIISLADTLGYYDAEGLDVEVIRLQGTPQVVAALQSGDADVGNIATGDAISLVAQDLLDVVAVNSSLADSGFVIASSTDLATPEDLAGATYAISQPGGQDDTMARAALTALGVNLDDIEFVSVGDPSARAQAVANGVVDAGTMSIGTYQSIADSTSVHLLVDAATFAELVPVVTKVNVVTAETAAGRQSAVQKFVTAQIKLARDFAADPHAWAEAVVAERPDLDVATLDAITDQYADSWCVNGCLGPDRLAATAEFLFTTDDLSSLPRIELDEWTDQTFVEQALETLGGPQAGIDPR